MIFDKKISKKKFKVPPLTPRQQADLIEGIVEYIDYWNKQKGPRSRINKKRKI